MSEEAQVDTVDMAQIDADIKSALAGQEDIDTEDTGDAGEDYSPAELKAMEMGWNPDPDSLEGTGKEWISAEEFVRNQSFYDEIKKLKREIRNQQKVTEAFKEQNKIVAERAYDQALLDLKKQKLQAAEDEDFKTIIEIDEKIEELKEDKKKATDAQATQFSATDWEDAYEDFVDSNSWYTENRAMRAFADMVGVEYAQNTPGVSPEDVYNYVIQEVQKEFKKEESPRPARAAAVSTGTRRAASPRGKAKHGIDDIPEEHRKIAMTLIKTGQLSEEDYLKQYFPEDYS